MNRPNVNVPPHIGYHGEFVRSALKYVGINTGEPPPHNWGALELRCLGWEAWLTPRNTLFRDMCYYIIFGCSATKGVYV